MDEHTGAYSMSAEDTDPARLSEQNVQVTQALEPCPFCGNRSPMRWKPHNVGDPVPSVWCEGCGAEVTPQPHHQQQDAIAAWNHRTRAEPDLVEAAKRVLEWWPEGSEEHSLAGKSKGGTFAADIRALRAALTRADV